MKKGKNSPSPVFKILGGNQMATIETIRDEILGFEVKDKFEIVEVEFEDYFLEVDLNDMKGLEINNNTLAQVIFENYMDEEEDEEEEGR